MFDGTEKPNAVYLGKIMAMPKPKFIKTIIIKG